MFFWRKNGAHVITKCKKKIVTSPKLILQVPMKQIAFNYA